MHSDEENQKMLALARAGSSEVGKPRNTGVSDPTDDKKDGKTPPAGARKS